MCGIGGIKRFGNQPIQRDPVDLLLCGLQVRGIDATGIGISNPDGVAVLRNDEPAWQFVSSKAYKEFVEEHLREDTFSVIVHTRMATKGNPRDNQNNHPMFHKKVAVVHNGVISNDDMLFRDLKLDRHAETDSDILRAILDAEGLSKAGIRRLSRVNGSVACAAISPDQPQHLLLVRSGSPLVLAAYGDLLVWASEKNIIHKAMRPWVDKFGLKFQQQKPDISFLTMRDNSAWLFGPAGLEFHDECKTSVWYREPERVVFGLYKERRDRWKDDDTRKKALPVARGTVDIQETLIRIPCPNCNAVNKLEPKQYNIDPTRLACGGCKKVLAVRATA